MLSIVYKALNVRDDERGKVVLMLGHGFFMGVFFATYVGTSETLFLNTIASQKINLGILNLPDFDPINLGIFTAGILGIITTSLFAFFQSKISYSRLAVINLVVIFLSSSLLYYLLANYSETSYYPYIVFFVFALNGPITAIFLLGFWGVFGRMFDLRQSKRIIGGIDTGQLTAAIIAFFLMGLFRIENIENYLIIGVSSIALSLVFLLMIINKYNLEVAVIHHTKQPETKFMALRKNEYVILLSIFLALSITAYLFVERTYLTVLNDQYAGKEAELLRFITWFNGSILIFSFIFQTFFNDAIIANYGLKVALLILPVVLSVFVVATVFLGFTIGTDVNSSSFYLFFLSVALSKLFITFLRDAMENPAYKLFFMPLNTKIRFDIQAKVEGVVNEFSKALAGMFILLLGFFAAGNLLSYYYMLALIIAGWIYITGKLYNEYRAKIKSKLESTKQGTESEQSIIQKIFEKLEEKLNQSRPDRAVFSFRFMEKLNPSFVGEGINKMMQNPYADVREYAQTKMNEIRGVSVSEKYVVKVKPTEDLSDKTLVQGNDLEDLFKTGDISKARISRLSRASKREDRQYAAELIGNSNNSDTLSYLIELLHDIEPRVRIAAIQSTQKRNNSEVLSNLIDNFSNSRYSNLVANSLIVLGSKSLNSLDSAFYKTGQGFIVMQKIIQVIGRIGGTRAKQILWNKIDYPDRVLASKVLVALGECEFRADFNQITRIKFAIESDIQDISWNIAAYNEVENTIDGNILKKAIKEENEHDSEHIYTLLGMLYDKQSIALVKENINSGTSEGVTYAIELLDVLLSEDLKQKVIPVLDDVSDSEKLKKLEFFYPRGRLDSKEVIKLLINRDFTQTNRWSKACALHMIGTMKIVEYTYDLIANLFNPDKIVSEMAAWSLYEINPDLYSENTARLDDASKRQFDLVILPKMKNDLKKYRSLRYEKTLFLMGMKPFSTVHGLILSMIVDEMEEVKLLKGATYSIEGEYGENFFCIYTGLVSYYRKGKIAKKFNKAQFIGELFEDEDAINSNLLLAEVDTVLWRIGKDKFYGLMSDDIGFAQKVIDQLKVA